MRNIIGIIILMSVCLLNARKFYFDIGVGYGLMNTIFQSMTIDFPLDGEQLDHSSKKSYKDLGNDLGFGMRLGYSLNNRLVLMVDFQINSEGVIEYNSKHDSPWYEYPFASFRETFYTVYGGIGVIYYPFSTFQTSISVGKADINRDVEVRFYHDVIDKSYRCLGRYSISGIGINLSLAYEIPMKFFGTLLGINFGYATDNRNSSSPFESTSIGLFARINNKNNSINRRT